MPRSKSSRQWMKAHVSDEFVRQAQKDGYRSRAVFKLEELDNKDRLFRPGMRVVDLGAAPGGWSQWLQRKFKGKVEIIALDILPMDQLPDVTFIQGDFSEDAILRRLTESLKERKVNLVMSDMSPNITGIRDVDQPRSMRLVEQARDFALEHLSARGHFVAKVFQGEGFDEFIRALRPRFEKVAIRKPKASKPASREVYVCAKSFRVE